LTVSGFEFRGWRNFRVEVFELGISRLESRLQSLGGVVVGLRLRV